MKSENIYIYIVLILVISLIEKNYYIKILLKVCIYYFMSNEYKLSKSPLIKYQPYAQIKFNKLWAQKIIK